MKRICNQSERELILKNRNQLLKGIYQTASKAKYSTIFVGLAFSIVVLFAGIFPLVEIFDGDKTAFWVWAVFSFTIPNLIVSVIMGKIRVKKEAKAFLKKDNLMINGATIVDVNTENKTFFYIEDDFNDANGNPIIINYPALPSGISAADVGKRLLVMYDGDSSFQLMQLNEELARLIPNYTEQYPLKRPWYELWRVPHPNVVSMDFAGHALSEQEKEYYAENYTAKTQKDSVKVLIICSVVIFICVMLISFIMGITEDCLEKALLIGLAICVGYVLLIAGARQLGKRNIKRTAQFEYMQEVVFHSNEINQRGRYVATALNVYEWKNNQFELSTYPGMNMPKGTQYGNVLYKFTNKKGKFIFVKK